MENKDKAFKGMEKIQKVCRSYFDSLPYKDKDDYLDEWCISSKYSRNMYYFMYESSRKRLIRETILDALVDTDYERKDKWSENSAVAFLHLVFKLANMREGSRYDTLIAKINKLFKVPKNRINTQAALFILNLEKDKDNFHLYRYFTRQEILLWKYRDKEDKLQEDIENERLNKSDLQIIKDYYGV